MIETILGVIIFALGGSYITWQYGKKKFAEGVISAIVDHYKGDLTYKTGEEDGDIFLEIQREVKEK